ncbi:C-type lectin domain family 10 member A-like isoform X1 [Pygocentrus nattereri]|uniref:C-type lectin domain family 10 member A-like isoform X1 n=1 Tax=Pygocentrus nattereri TaxID=42514 RepID=UPI0008148FA8|nr:C-type lectin domain family 10 member A-like isoform X1 [Pygocentrus nattereri]
MAAIYSNVNFINSGTRKPREDEPFRAVAQNEELIYSTVRFSTDVGPSHSDLHRPDKPADPSPEPKSKAVTTGQAKERILWISLCAVLFVVALIIGVLFIYGHVSHKETVQRLTGMENYLNKTQKNYTAILEEKKNLQDNISRMENDLNETQKNYTAILEEKKNLQDMISRMKNDLNKTQKSYTAILEEKKILQHNISMNDKIIQQLQAEKKQTCDRQSLCVDQSCCTGHWKYFNGKCYSFSTDVKTWTASRDACVAAGGDLVIISNVEEEIFIKRSKPGDGEQRYWVGLTDAVKEGDWRWLDGTRLSQTAQYWTGNEPDNWKGVQSKYPEGEDCAVMALSTNSYVLLDAFCDAEEKKFMHVCEAKAPK